MKENVLGVLIDAIDYTHAVDRIQAAARARTALAVSALAVHGVMTGVLDREHRQRLNSFDILAPDGQPVRWALNALYRVRLTDTVRGTDLTLRVLAQAEESGLPVYFYGSTTAVLDRVQRRLSVKFPDLRVARAMPSRFTAVPAAELNGIAADIVASGARIVFVGLGCPRQERFVHELCRLLDLPVLAVGAAFDYIAGTLKAPPMRLRRHGLEWAWRLALEPRRLWRRYLLFNPLFIVLLLLQALRLWHPDMSTSTPRALAVVDV